MKKTITLALALMMVLTLLAGCGGSGDTAGPKTLVIGDTTFNPENGEPDVNPHNDYSGWPCIRYGIGETLVRYSDSMEVEPWLATDWENDGDCTWTITLREGVKFSSGRDMDAAAVKQCLEHLIEVHERAAGDLNIASIEADGQTLTIVTKSPKPALLNYLGDPYGCIIDVDAGFEGGIVAGTGPYIATDCQSGDHLTLVKNENYWDGDPKLDQITIRNITDGDTLANALQSGEIDCAYGMAYESYPLFENDNFTFSGISTSRAFFCWMNYESPVVSDPAVRKAIAMGIDKKGFVDTLLEGHGNVATGAFPDDFPYGGRDLTTETYNPDGAKKVLEDAGWVDSDGDGIREKDGKKLTINWLTYPSRQELPLLAEYAQATLKDIGIEVNVNSTADHKTILKDPTQWDVYASAQVNAPTGDPEYFFSVCCLDSSSANRGHFHSDKLEELAKQMSSEFDTDKRAELAIQMQQEILDDNAYVFCSFLQMNMISRAGVTGYTAHACDYYQVTADLDVTE